jgi:hypothetical protein
MHYDPLYGAVTDVHYLSSGNLGVISYKDEINSHFYQMDTNGVINPTPQPLSFSAGIFIPHYDGKLVIFGNEHNDDANPVLRKCSMDGTVLWKQSLIVSSQNTFTQGMLKTDDNGLMLLCTSDYEALRLLRADSSGTVLRQKLLYDEEIGQFPSGKLLRTTDGRYIVLCFDRFGAYRIYCYNDQIDQQWWEYYPYDTAQSIAETQDGGFYALGGPRCDSNATVHRLGYNGQYVQKYSITLPGQKNSLVSINRLPGNRYLLSGTRIISEYDHRLFFACMDSSLQIETYTEFLPGKDTGAILRCRLFPLNDTRFLFTVTKNNINYDCYFGMLKIISASRPQFTTFPENRIIDPLIEFSDTVYATIDYAGNSIAYMSSADNPPGFSVGEKDGIVSWIPGYNDTGTHMISIYAIDRFEQRDTIIFSLNVPKEKLPPLFTEASMSNRYACANVLFIDSVKAAFYGTNPLFYKIISGPDGCICDSITGHFSWLPDAVFTGNILMSIAATDGNKSDTATFTINVAGDCVFKTGIWLTASLGQSCSTSLSFSDGAEMKLSQTGMACVPDTFSVIYMGYIDDQNKTADGKAFYFTFENDSDESLIQVDFSDYKITRNSIFGYWDDSVWTGVMTRYFPDRNTVSSGIPMYGQWIIGNADAQVNTQNSGNAHLPDLCFDAFSQSKGIVILTDLNQQKSRNIDVSIYDLNGRRIYNRVFPSVARKLFIPHQILKMPALNIFIIECRFDNSVVRKCMLKTGR